MTRSEEIEKIELTEEEIRLAIWQAKFTKWNALRFKDYWNDKEKEVAESRKNVRRKTSEEATAVGRG